MPITAQFIVSLDELRNAIENLAIVFVLIICGLQVATWFPCGCITFSVFRKCNRSYKCREAQV